MKQEKLYPILYKRLKKVDSELAETFADRCFENNQDYMNLEYRKNTLQFTVTKKDMIDDYFFWLNTAIDNATAKILKAKDAIREAENEELGEWLEFNEKTEEWE